MVSPSDTPECKWNQRSDVLSSRRYTIARCMYQLSIDGSFVSRKRILLAPQPSILRKEELPLVRERPEQRCVTILFSCKSTVAALIARGFIDNSIEFSLGYSRSTNYGAITGVIRTLAYGSNVLLL